MCMRIANTKDMCIASHREVKPRPNIVHANSTDIILNRTLGCPTLRTEPLLLAEANNNTFSKMFCP